MNTLPPDFPLAACRVRPHFFDGRRPTENVGLDRSIIIPRHRAAKQICGTCPHIDDCRDWALANWGDPMRPNGAFRENGPVIGGLTDHERIQHRHKYHMPDPAPYNFTLIRNCGHSNNGTGETAQCHACRHEAKRADSQRRAAEKYREQAA